jgi:hypothetical protein
MGYFMTIWYILCSFGTFFPVLVPCTKKNLATLATTEQMLALISSPRHQNPPEIINSKSGSTDLNRRGVLFHTRSWAPSQE